MQQDDNPTIGDYGHCIVFGNYSKGVFKAELKSLFPDAQIPNSPDIVSGTIWLPHNGSENGYVTVNVRHFINGYVTGYNGTRRYNVQLIGSSLPKDSWRPVVDILIHGLGLEDVLYAMENYQIEPIRSTTPLDRSGVKVPILDRYSPDLEGSRLLLPSELRNISRQ